MEVQSGFPGLNYLIPNAAFALMLLPLVIQLARQGMETHNLSIPTIDVPRPNCCLTIRHLPP